MRLVVELECEEGQPERRVQLAMAAACEGIDARGPNSGPKIQALANRFKPPIKKTKLRNFCGDERDRTVGLLSAIQALSQLSYIPNRLAT